MGGSMCVGCHVCLSKLARVTLSHAMLAPLPERNGGFDRAVPCRHFVFVSVQTESVPASAGGASPSRGDRGDAHACAVPMCALLFDLAWSLL